MKRSAILVLLLATLKIFAADPPQVAAVLKHAGRYEVSVIFSTPMNTAAMGDPENYSITPGTIVGLRLCATNSGAVLNVSGLAPGAHAFLNVANMMDAGDNLVPDTMLDFSTSDRFWAEIGANELGFPYDAYGYPTNGVDLFNGGIQQREDYDEATFVGEPVSGDFEAKVRVDYVDPAGAGAKAGIMIREQVDENKTRPLDPDSVDQAFSRYVELAVSSPISVLGESSSGHQIWQRAVAPTFETLSLTVTNDEAPAFPNAWLRVERVGQQIIMSRSVDGQSWQQIGGATFDPPLSTNVQVGLAFSAQNDDITANSGLRGTFAAKFRDYSLTQKNDGNLRIKMAGDHAEVTWDSGWILEMAATVNGLWTAAASQQSPVPVDIGEAMRFFRLRRVGS